MYSVHGKTAATAATIDHAIAGLWNPSTSRRIKVREVSVFKQGAGATDEPVLRRMTARGTPGSTITPTAVNHFERDQAPPSATVLDLAAYTVQPTLEALGFDGAVLPAAAGSGFVWVFAEPVEIPAGNGLVLTTGVALAFPVSRVGFKFTDG